MNIEKVLFSWSGGKDSAMALHEVLGEDRLEVVALMTTVADPFRRISHHGVREELLDLQSASLGLPIHKLRLPGLQCTNEIYESKMREALLAYRDQGVGTVVFGDIFLEDLRQYREKNLQEIGMSALFPLWRRDTTELVETFDDLGFRATISCIDGEKLDKVFAGRRVDRDLLRDLPAGVDPCGENGEYHSFAHAGPIFDGPIEIEVGEVVQRDTRFFADLLPRNVSLGVDERTLGDNE